MIITFLLLCLFFLLGCYRSEYQESRDFIATYQKQMQLMIYNQVGHVVVEEGEWEEVLITVQLKGRADSEPLAKQIVQETKILITPVEEGLEIRSDKPKHLDASLQIDYHVKIPVAFNCMVNNSVGDTSIKRIHGDVSVVSATGRVLVDSLQGDIEVRGGTGDIQLGTIDGDINVSTSTGDIQIDYAIGEVHLLETGTGSICATLEIPRNTNNFIRSSTGDITLYLRGELSTQLHVIVGTGTIQLEGLDLFLGQKEDKRVVGMIGSGESHLKVQTSTGDVLIMRD